MHGAAGPHHTWALLSPAYGLTLHLSSCNNVTGRDAGHVDQVDGTVSLRTGNTVGRREHQPHNLTRTKVTGPAQSWPQRRPLHHLALPSGWRSSAGNAGLVAAGWGTPRNKEGTGSAQHQSPAGGHQGKMPSAEPHIFYQPTPRIFTT